MTLVVYMTMVINLPKDDRIPGKPKKPKLKVE